MDRESYCVYLIKCADESLYCGHTSNMEKRIQTHNAGMASKYTRARRPVKLVYFEVLPTKSEALKRESKIKSFSRSQKLSLIEKGRSTT